MALEDWVVPVHYQRRDIHFPQFAIARSVSPPLDAMLDDIRERAADAGDGADLDPVGTFVGRDGLFYELEVACRAHRAVVLHGPGGTGKTELAKAFGRWSLDTAGAQMAIVHSFEPGVASFGLDGVLAAIGLQAFGKEFARVELGERERVILTGLREHSLLLIWDNFEWVFQMPDPTGATPPLDKDERARIARFVAAIAAGGRSALLITSRTPERWLGDGIARLPVGGLNREETVQYADALLAGIPASRARRAHPAFGQLLDALDGHPLGMRLVLPHIATTDPEELLDALHGRGELPIGHETERLASLQSCVGYSIEHLDPKARRLLTAVSLFHGVVDVDVLATLSTVDEVPERFAGIDRDAWAGALEAAANVGLLTSIGAGLYRIHPALPAYLAKQGRDERDRYDSHSPHASHALLITYVSFGEWLFNEIQTGHASLALGLIELQRRTIGHLLGSALEGERWQEAQAIAQPLIVYLDSRGLYEEARGWVDRARQATEAPDGTAPDADTPSGALWVFLVGSQAGREIHQGRLASAQRTFEQLVKVVRRQTPSSTQQLNLAGGYHNLGIVAQERGRLDDAKDWYHRALTIHEELGNRPGIATTHHQLGRVAQERGRLDDAEDWYYRALTIFEELGNRPGIATSYVQLGVVAQRQGRLDDAEDWHRQSLTIHEELGNRPGIATGYHNLGTIAWLRGRLDDAEDWYLQSLTINEEIGTRVCMADSYRQLGLVAEARDRPADALEWMVRCVQLFDEFLNPAMGPAPAHLARLTAQLGMQALEACWQAVTSHALPSAVRDHIDAQNTNDDKK
jgi:tetratricopeptide (TPR) repeat protein